MALVCPSCDVVPPADAEAGASCAACGSRLVEGPGLELIDLDQRDGSGKATVPSPQKAPPVDIPPPPPPMMDPAADAELKIDSAWEREREERRANPPPSHAAKRFAAEATRAPPKKSGASILITSLLVVAALGGVAVYVVTQMRPPKPTAPIATRPPIVVTPERPRDPPRPVDSSAQQPLPTRGVSIRIIAAPGTPITIDGALAGKGTVSLKRTAGKKPMTIAAPGVKRTIVPDRDQTIDLTKP